MKKILAFVLAMIMVMAMGTVAFAADTIDDNTTVGAAGWTVTFNDTFKITDGDDAANLPAATFIYTITAGSGAAATTTSPLITAGVVDGSKPSITNSTHTATESGITTNTVDVKVDFTGVPFTAAGIYRYNVKVAQDASNVTKDDISLDVKNTTPGSGSYILDVYVKKVENGTATTFEPYAYVLSKSGAINTFTTGTNENTVTYNESEKVDTITHEYTTYNLTVKKVIKGDLAANSFDFTITISNVPTGVIFTQDAVNKANATSYTLTAALTNNGTTVIKGLPSTVTYAIKEAVNQLEGYTVEVTDDNKAHGTYTWIGTAGSATEYGNATATTIGDADTAVQFTNTLNNISPTGVVMRVAPFAIMLGAGVVLLVLSKKRKSED